MKACFSRGFSLALALGSLSLTGCALLPGASEAPQQRVMGLLEKSAGQWSLQPCGAAASLRVAPAQQLDSLFEQVAQPGQTAIFVDLLGHSGGSGQFMPGQVLRMQSSGHGCAATLLADNQWLAFSHQPAWQLEVNAQGMRLRDGETRDQQRLPMISEQLGDGALNFRTLRDQNLDLWLYPQPCIERESGDYYHVTATLIRDDQRLEGCAYRGQL